jgi:microcystin-dependent protein
MRRVALSLTAIALLALFFVPAYVQAQSEPYIGQLMLVGFNFCPRGWASASGQLLSIAQNTALFALLGTTYGGNGQTTFALPDLRGRVPVGVGQGPGLTPINQGEVAGSESHTLLTSEMPAHTHPAFGSTAPPSSLSPTGKLLAKQDRVNIYTSPGSATQLAPQTIGPTGGSQPFPVRDPYVGMQWCIALQGIFPPRD